MTTTNNLVVTPGVGNELLQQVRAALTTLAEIQRHRERMGNEAVQMALDVVADARRRIDRQELFVCVVGEKKVGKSTFLNAILGRPILSAAVRECTGSVTMIRAHRDVDFCATLENGSTERLADAFPDRRPQLERARLSSEQQVQRCHRDATELPARLANEKRQSAEAESALQSLGGELDLATQRYDSQCRDLGVKQTELLEFAAQLDDQGRLIPYGYRRLPDWYNPIRWLWQWLGKRWARQEWLQHLEKHRQLNSAEQELNTLREYVRGLLQQQRSLREKIVETDQRRVALERSIGATERGIAALPEKTVTREGRYKRIQAGMGEYENRRQQVFADSIRQFTDLEKRGSQVRRLEIWVPTPNIPAGLVIIDTPGVNTDNEVNRARAWETIRRDADGCIVLSDIQQTVSQSTREFVREVKGYLPHIMLVLTKVDRAIESAEFDGESVDDQIEEARRVGEERFAAEVGRAPGDILSFAVSAQRALRNDDEVAARRFAEDTATMAEILRNERALIVASRCATTIGTVQEQIAEAQSAAEKEYARQIAFLESNRIPDPASFCRAQMRTVDSSIEQLAEEIVELGIQMIDKSYDAMSESYCKEILSCTSGDQLKSYLSSVQDALAGHIQQVNRAIQQDLAGPTSTAVKELEEPLLRALRERYQIVSKIAGTAGASIASSSLGVRHTLPDISFNLSGLVQDFQYNQLGGIAGGAATGALLGSVIPGLGTLVGGVIGSLAGLFFGPKFEDIRTECVQKFVVVMTQAKRTGMTEFANNQPQIQRELRAALERALDQAVRQYGSWINEVIKAEQLRIATERGNLAHLQQLGERMNAHLRELERLMEEAQNQSRGLAR